MTFLGLGPGCQGSAAEERKEKGCSELPAMLVCAQKAAQHEAITAGHCASPARTMGLPHEPWVLEYVMPK